MKYPDKPWSDRAMHAEREWRREKDWRKELWHENESLKEQLETLREPDAETLTGIPHGRLLVTAHRWLAESESSDGNALASWAIERLSRELVALATSSQRPQFLKEPTSANRCTCREGERCGDPDCGGSFEDEVAWSEEARGLRPLTAQNRREIDRYFANQCRGCAEGAPRVVTEDGVALHSYGNGGTMVLCTR